MQKSHIIYSHNYLQWDRLGNTKVPSPDIASYGINVSELFFEFG